jgi:hypothetical protein
MITRRTMLSGLVGGAVALLTGKVFGKPAEEECASPPGGCGCGSSSSRFPPFSQLGVICCSDGKESDSELTGNLYFVRSAKIERAGIGCGGGETWELAFFDDKDPRNITAVVTNLAESPRLDHGTVVQFFPSGGRYYMVRGDV